MGTASLGAYVSVGRGAKLGTATAGKLRESVGDAETKLGKLLELEAGAVGPSDGI